MSRADYAHWNEDADFMWWHEEGKHIEEPPEYDDDDWRLDMDAYEDECSGCDNPHCSYCNGDIQLPEPHDGGAGVLEHVPSDT